MKNYLVETLVTYRMRYVVEAENETQANEFVNKHLTSNVLKEFSQLHIGEEIFSTRKIKDKEYLKLFNKDNGYLETWTDEEKFEYINKVNEKEPTEPNGW